MHDTYTWCHSFRAALCKAVGRLAFQQPHLTNLSPVVIAISAGYGKFIKQKPQLHPNMVWPLDGLSLRSHGLRHFPTRHSSVSSV